MISVAQLDLLAQARLDDSKALLAAQRADGATYLCGYAIELTLKARICRQLNWAEFPDSKKEFESYQSFKTHDLDVLLRLSGQENQIKQAHFTDWNNVSTWKPEARYKMLGGVTPSQAADMVESTERLLKVL